MKKNTVFFYFLLFFCSFTTLFSATEESKKKTICLNMIVKNETQVIKRCLDSVRPIIDYWVISDTGSTDGTQAMIKNHMKDVPGELVERPWINFGFNRNEALQLAKGKCDYILFIDADEVLVYEKGFELPYLDKDMYYIMTHFNNTIYARVQLIKDALNWKWIGVLHETLDAPEPLSTGTLELVYNDVHTDGARSQDPDKYKKDVKVLEAGLIDEPNNTRYVFYLAQSYKDAGDYQNALKNYKKRIVMGGWNEEMFYSMYQAGVMEQALESPQAEIEDTLMRAYYFRPTRMEPLYQLAHYYRTKEQYAMGYFVAKYASTIPMPNDLLFVQKWMYDQNIWLELSICAYWIGKYDECAIISRRLLDRKDLSDNFRQAVENNLKYAEKQGNVLQ